MGYKFLLLFFMNNSFGMYSNVDLTNQKLSNIERQLVEIDLKKELDILLDFHLFCMSFKYKFNMINKDPDVKKKFDENLKILAKKYKIDSKNIDYECCIKILRKMQSKCFNKKIVKAFKDIIYIINYHYVKEEYKNNPMINAENQLIATNFAVHSNVQYILANSKYLFGIVGYDLESKIDLHNS